MIVNIHSNTHTKQKEGRNEWEAIRTTALCISISQLDYLCVLFTLYA